MAYGAVTATEASETVQGVLPGVRGHDGLEDVLHDVPELVVVLLEEKDNAGGLGVERGRDILDDVASDLLDLAVWDRRRVGELVDRTTVVDGLEEVGCVGHFDGVGECTGSDGIGDWESGGCGN